MLIFYILFFLVILFLLSYFLKILDLIGSIFAFVLGFLVTYFGSFYFLILLIVFVSVSFLATKYKHSKKEKFVGFENTRSWISVVSKGIVPLIVALMPFNFMDKAILFSVAVAAATSDTISGEIGVLSDNAFYITNFKKAKPGENGAVSLSGEFWAFVGSLIIAIFALAFFNIGIFQFIFIIIFGFLGSQFDSIFGYIFENRGKIKKYTVNILAIGISIILAYLIML